MHYMLRSWQSTVDDLQFTVDFVAPEVKKTKKH
jgi:hypothetical protein